MDKDQLKYQQLKQAIDIAQINLHQWFRDQATKDGRYLIKVDTYGDNQSLSFDKFKIASDYLKFIDDDYSRAILLDKTKHNTEE